MYVAAGTGSPSRPATSRSSSAPAVRLDLGLERVTPGDGEAGLPVTRREADPFGQPGLVDPRAVQHGTPGAARVAGQRGDRPGVVPPGGDRAPDPVEALLAAGHETPR